MKRPNRYKNTNNKEFVLNPLFYRLIYEDRPQNVAGYVCDLLNSIDKDQSVVNGEECLKKDFGKC